jgi:hypothetical protein
MQLLFFKLDALDVIRIVAKLTDMVYGLFVTHPPVHFVGVFAQQLYLSGSPGSSS